MRDSALSGVDAGTSQFLLGNLLTQDALDYSRTGQEHVGSVLDHDGEIGEGGGIYGSTCARTENPGDLGNHSRGEDIPLENLPVAGERVDTFLDPGSTGIVEADERGAIAGGQVQDLADFLRHGLGKRAAGYREILCGHIDQPATNRAHTCHDAVTVEMLLVHSEVHTAVTHEHVELLKTAFVEQQGQPFPCGELPFLVLGVNSFLSSTQFSGGSFLDQFGDIFLLNAHIPMI